MLIVWLLPLAALFQSTTGEENKTSGVLLGEPPKPHQLKRSTSDQLMNSLPWDGDGRDEKRSRKFSSWGGKRDDLENILLTDDEERGKPPENHLAESDELPWKDDVQEPPSEDGVFSDPNVIDQVEKRKFSSWGGKRGNEGEKRAKFSSWGGKRNEYVDSDLLAEKRAKFSSWGGKRNNRPPLLYGGKRRFSSWGGKRSYEDDKRAKFSSWGGKRGGDEDLAEEKRAKFSSWGGKRAKFSSWGGKRSQEDDENQDASDILSDLNYGKRGKFSSWGGKRTMDDSFITPEEKRAKFSSWGGKRDPLLVENKRVRFYGWGGKRYYSQNPNWVKFFGGKRAKFSSWGGKRSTWDFSDNYLDEEKRAKFSSWGGKRDTVNSNNSSTAYGTDSNTLNDVLLEQKRNPTYSFWESYPELRSFTYKRKPVFSSWGGKRTLDNGDSSSHLSPGYQQWLEKELKSYSNEKSNNIESILSEINNEVSPALSSEEQGRLHRVQARSVNNQIGNPWNKKSPKPYVRRLYLKNNIIKEGTWTSVLRPIRRGVEFYAWGGKRSNA